jgi:hypothetical protein
MLMANLNYKMGTNKFYNIFGVSANNVMWGAIYGFGTNIRAEKKLSLNFDLSFTNMSYKKTFETQLCMKTKLSTDINFRLNKNLYLFTGLSYNILTSDKIIDKDLQNYLSETLKQIMQTRTFKSVRLQSWPGLMLGIKYNLN